MPTFLAPALPSLQGAPAQTLIRFRSFLIRDRDDSCCQNGSCIIAPVMEFTEVRSLSGGTELKDLSMCISRAICQSKNDACILYGSGHPNCTTWVNFRATIISQNKDAVAHQRIASLWHKFSFWICADRTCTGVKLLRVPAGERIMSS